MMTIVAGAVCILAGVARLGFVTELLSKPIRYGYIAAIASRRFGRSLWSVRRPIRCRLADIHAMTENVSVG
jgi:Sulfate permease family